MDRIKIFILGTMFLVGVMLTCCAWHKGDYDSHYYNLGHGFGYYGYYQWFDGGEEYPVFDARHGHHH